MLVGQSSEESIGSAAENAAYEELEKTEWPPKNEDAERVGGAVGAAAAGAACAAMGAPVASPACAALGGAIGRAIAGAVWEAAGSLLDNVGNRGVFGDQQIRRVWKIGIEFGIRPREWNYDSVKAFIFNDCMASAEFDLASKAFIEYYYKALSPTQSYYEQKYKQALAEKWTPLLVWGEQKANECEKKAIARLIAKYAPASLEGKPMEVEKNRSTAEVIIAGGAVLGIGYIFLKLIR